MNEAPKLLVEWSSPWQEFIGSIGPALGRSPVRLAGEAQTGLFPVRGMLVSWGMEAIFLAVLILLPGRLANMRPSVPLTPPKYDVIYFSADELPQIEDRGGAQAGRTGRAGGKAAHHRTQTIRVARGNAAVEKVVDAPDLKLPVSNAPVANLLAFKSVPGPPPAEGLKSSRTAPALSKNSIVAPPPEVSRERSRSLPGLASNVIVPPPADAAPEKTRPMMGLSTTIIAPAPREVPRDHSHSVVALTSRIIQPAPTDIERVPPPLRGPAAAASVVVPPPASAPQRESAQTPKLALPAPGVIAPPPSQVTRDPRVSGVGLSDPKVVPPPVELGGRSQDKQAIVGLVGANQVVPPPPSVTGGTSVTGGGGGRSDKAGGFGATLTGENIVPPPPSVAGDASLSRSGRGRGGPQGSLGGGLGTNAVVPPPPSLSGAGGLSGRGTGGRGAGLGGPLDAGSVLAPPSAGGGNGGGKGVVVSSQPGSVQGVPRDATPGIIAMSPGGGANSGVGGSGGGAGINHGNGPGSGLNGEGSGAAKEGAGRGSDPNSHGGISPYPGPGGAGRGTDGQPPIPGVSVAGGNTSTSTITLPSFGPGESDPGASPGRSGSSKARRGLGVSVFGTSRSGGAFSRYGQLRGDNYTIYITTAVGLAVMQYADSASAARPYTEKLIDPEPLRVSLPEGLSRSRLVVACVLGRSGTLSNIRVIEPGPQPMTKKVVAALYAWKFTPALHGNEPVEVNAFLGFNIDTR